MTLNYNLYTGITSFPTSVVFLSLFQSVTVPHSDLDIF